MSEYLLSQLFGPENEKVEYKYLVPPPKSLARLIASFANTEGGKIIFGVKDTPLSVSGLPEGLPVWAIIQSSLEHLKPQPVVYGGPQSQDSFWPKLR
jgi:predicted HTH transcriptional regulator